MSVNEYVTKFTQLFCYALNEVDTDEKKQDCLLNGLNDRLAYALEARDFENFQGMVNKALMLENRRCVMERKRNLVHQHQSGSSSRPRIGPPSAGHVSRPAQSQLQPRSQPVEQGFSTPQRQVIQCPNNSHTPAARNQNVQMTQAAQNPMLAEQKRHACGESGHYTNQCPNLHVHPPQTAASTPAPTRGSSSILVAAKQNYARGRVNHVAVEDDQEAPDVVIGMFSIKGTSAIMLFDSGASYFFISAAYVWKHNLPLALL
jgi:hypothetical protein